MSLQQLTIILKTKQSHSRKIILMILHFLTKNHINLKFLQAKKYQNKRKIIREKNNVLIFRLEFRVWELIAN